MQPDSSTLQCLGACLADTAAPRSLPEERRLVFFAMLEGYNASLLGRNFDRSTRFD
jgi:hypothetical protein